MKKKNLLLIALAAMTLASCGKESGSDGATETDTLTLQIFAGGYGTAPWKYALKKFEAAHPEYKVDAYMDNNVNTKFEDRWMNGNPPDFVFLDGTIATNTWLAEGLLSDLSEWLETAKAPGEEGYIKDKVNAAYWRKYTGSDKKTITYGAPLLLTAYGMWYDQTLFSEKGWTMPSNYEGLKAFAGKATNDIKSLIYPGVYSGYLVQGMLVPAFAEYGETFFKRVMNCEDADVYTSKEFKEVMTRFNDFINLNDNVVAECLSLNHTESQQEWLKRKAAMIPNGLWLRSEMDKLHAIPDDFNMHYAPSPLVKEKQTIVSSSVCCGIAKQAKNKVGAQKFLESLYADDVLKQFVYASDSPSVAPLDLSDDPNITDVNKYVQTVFNDTKYQHMSNDGSWGDVDAAINSAVNSLVKKTTTVDEACEAIKAAAVKTIKDRQ